MKRLSITLFAFLIIFPAMGMANRAANMNTYDELLVLFEDWRKFETPPLLEGAPDYTAKTTARKTTARKTTTRSTKAKAGAAKTTTRKRAAKK